MGAFGLRKVPWAKVTWQLQEPHIHQNSLSSTKIAPLPP